MLGLLLADCVGRVTELVEVSRLLMVDSMRVRLDQCKEVLLIAGELESMKVQMNVVYILVVFLGDHGCSRDPDEGITVCFVILHRRSRSRA